jgi:hypothetical protein
MFLQGVERGTLRRPGFMKTERESIDMFGLLFLREIVFALGATHFADRINYALGKGTALGASFHRRHGIECMPGELGRQGLRMPDANAG